MKRSFLTLFTALILTAAFPLTADTIYKWVDENGTIHFGERPPQGVKAEQVGVSTQPEQPSDPYAETRAAQAVQRDAGTEQQNEMNEAYALEQQKQARMEAACVAQKARLGQLVPRPKVLLQNPDGTTRMLGDQERLDMIEESQNFIDQNCPDD